MLKTASELDLSMEQDTAVEMSVDLNLRLVGVTGGAGTGKTTILRHVYTRLHDMGFAVVLVAPTGRAAKRIQEATGIPAKTIHRLLEFPRLSDEDYKAGEAGMPKRNRSNPLLERVILVDESSMIGPQLYGQLMDALRPSTCVRFFGDNNQLPPVEKGKAPFEQILTRFPSIELQYNYRSNDAIVSNALRILKGSVPQRNAAFDIVYSGDPIKTMLEMVQEGEGRAFTGADHQILIPGRKGHYGTMYTNPRLQLIFNPDGPHLRLPRFEEDDADLTVRKEDKFLWTRNDYTFEMYNGETGTVHDIDTEDGTLVLATEERIVTIPPSAEYFHPAYGRKIIYDPRKQLELGYCITTHKAQGSEFKVVMYVCTGVSPYLLNRRNFYTAITRAKERVIMICDNRAMSYSVRAYRS
jgi:exodeoxyribonuclease V alpha subunit